MLGGDLLLLREDWILIGDLLLVEEFFSMFNSLILIKSIFCGFFWGGLDFYFFSFNWDMF